MPLLLLLLLARPSLLQLRLSACGTGRTLEMLHVVSELQHGVRSWLL